MSRENVEIVRRAIDAFNDGDLDAALRDVDPEVECDSLSLRLGHDARLTLTR